MLELVIISQRQKRPYKNITYFFIKKKYNIFEFDQRFIDATCPLKKGQVPLGVPLGATKVDIDY